MERDKCTCYRVQEEAGEEGERESGTARLYCVNCQPQKCAKKSKKKMSLVYSGRGIGATLQGMELSLQQDATSPHRQRCADFNLKCICCCRSLFAALYPRPRPRPPFTALTVSVVSANLFCTQILLPRSELVLLFGFRVFLSQQNFAKLATLPGWWRGRVRSERVLFYELIKTLTTNSKVYMHRVSLTTLPLRPRPQPSACNNPLRK